MRSRDFKYPRKEKHDGLGCLLFCPESTSSEVDTGTELPSTSTTDGQTSTTPLSSDSTQTSASGSSTTTSGTSASVTPSSISSSSTLSSILSSSAPSSTVSSSTSSSSANTPPPSSTTPAAPVSTSYIVTTSDDQIVTLTQSVIVELASSAADSTSSPPPTASPTAAASTSIVDNKPLFGSVVGISSAIALILITVLITMSFRKSRRNKLEREALTEQLPWPSIGDDVNSLAGDGKRAPSDESAPASDRSPVVMYPSQAYGAPPPQAFAAYQPPVSVNPYGQPQQWTAPSAQHGGYAPQGPLPGLHAGHFDQIPVTASSAYSGMA